VSQTKSDAPDQQKDDAWHRHPALIAAIPAVGAVVGAALTIFLGQAGALPAAINPAPAPTTVFATETATATSTVTETVTETPTTEPSAPEASNPTLGTPPPGGLAVTVRIGRSGQIGPNEYRAGAIPTASVEVLDESGQNLSSGCFPTWVLKRGSAVIKTARSGSCWDTFHFSTDSLEVRGIYHLTVSVVTEGGAKGSSTADFKVS
jgi:hypothetical protein